MSSIYTAQPGDQTAPVSPTQHSLVAKQDRPGVENTGNAKLKETSPGNTVL